MTLSNNMSKHNILVDLTDYFPTLVLHTVIATTQVLLKFKHTCSTYQDVHIFLAQTRPPTHADGLRGAMTIKLIRLKSLTVTSCRKPAAGSCCSPRHGDSSVLRGLQGPFSVTVPFLNYT